MHTCSTTSHFGFGALYSAVPKEGTTPLGPPPPPFPPSTFPVPYFLSDDSRNHVSSYVRYVTSKRASEEDAISPGWHPPLLTGIIPHGVWIPFIELVCGREVDDSLAEISEDPASPHLGLALILYQCQNIGQQTQASMVLSCMSSVLFAQQVLQRTCFCIFEREVI